MSNITAKIFDIQRNSFVDGPGIRTTVFFKSCNLKCAWCHNPEGQSAEKKWMIYPNKCVGCGRCVGIDLENTDFICLHDAKIICGKEYTVAEVLSVVLKDKRFYESSGGGVTFSGGECMLQTDFLEAILKECKKSGIHTAVDTAGHVPFEYFERILPYTDLFLYDVKCLNNEKHKQYTGVPNDLILSNLKRLLQLGKAIWIRIPIIPDVNDNEEELLTIKAFLSSYGCPEKVELLPYHDMGEHKYAALGKMAQTFSVPSEEKMMRLKKIFL
jgi:pyruvate formate lyase activating enzyme